MLVSFFFTTFAAIKRLHMIQRLTSIPTDAEYLRAFRENNNPLISKFIRQNMDKFLAVIKKSFGITSSVYVGLTILRRIADYFV